MFCYLLDQHQRTQTVVLPTPLASSSTAATSTAVHEQSIAVDVRVGHIRLLRQRSVRGQVLFPVVPTNHLLLLFPGSLNEVRDGLSGSAVDAMGRFLGFLQSSTGLQVRVAEAAVCASSAVAVVVLHCRDVLEALTLMAQANDVRVQDDAMRMSSLFIQAHPCDGSTVGSSTPVDRILSQYYYIPTCVLCADRLEAALTGYTSELPMCRCAEQRRRCTCLLTSTCRVCQEFLGAQSHSDARGVKCEHCGQSGDPWICSICGYVGCSRYQAQHAKDHYVASQHSFSINLLTQQIWDYEGDAFAHRMLLFVDSDSGGTRRVIYPEPSPLPMDSVEDAVASVEKQAVKGKDDAKLSTSSTQYAAMIKNELDRMRVSSHASADDGATLDCIDVLLEESRAVQLRRRAHVMENENRIQNLLDEFHARRAEGQMLEEIVGSQDDELRRAVRAGVEMQMRHDATIRDLEATLEEIALNRAAQRQIAAHLDPQDATSSIYLMGGAPAGRRRKGR